MKTTNREKLMFVIIVWLLTAFLVQRSRRIDAEDGQKFLSGKLVEIARSTNTVIRPRYTGTIQIGTNFYTRTTDNKLEIKQ